MWVCVSVDFDVKSLLGKILVAATNTADNNGLSKDQLQVKLRQELDGKKYLLVLDDVWNEDDVMKWNELKNILIQGGRGSKIIVTTRSKRVANVAGSYLTHELQGLSDDDSWKLFHKVALMESHLVEIGKEIVCKCFNVPLAIRFVGSLLQGQNERMWQSLKDTDLAHIKQDGNDGIIPVLKISYNHLPQHLKNCFSYCAVYPKDYKFMKEEMIYLWMAQGFIKPSHNGLSLEDLGEDYFMKLLQRCFFQDVEKDDLSGYIKSCKMHDLVHDLAKGVARKEIKSSSDDICSLHEDKTRHIFIDDTLAEIRDAECYLTKMKKLRTCLVRQSKFTSFYLRFPFNMRTLRVLDLSRGVGQDKRNMEKLSSNIGELLHLRYLDVYFNSELSELPNSITQLYNLQTLRLRRCTGIEELPRELSKLINLRHLDIERCDRLRHMPPGMNGMTCLHKLTSFVVGNVKKNTRCLGPGDVGNLEDLKDLNSLRDGLKIVVKYGGIYEGEEVKKWGYLINKPFLNEIEIVWDDQRSVNDIDAEAVLQWLHSDYDDDEKAMLQGLQPHPNIKRLVLSHYPGVGFPRWGQSSSMNLNMNTPLPNLVHIHIHSCIRLKHLPLLSQLRHLKFLKLQSISNLEYVESRNFRRTDELVFFPSLEILELEDLPALKGLLIVPEEEDINDSSSSKDNSNKEEEEGNDAWRCLAPTLRQLILVNLRSMKELPKGTQHLTSLRELHISRCDNLEEIPAWIGCLSSLQHLDIWYCKRVKTLPNEMHHLTCLTQLKLYGCSWEFKKRYKKSTGADWPTIQHIPSLHIT